jgi:hypothetical protein
MELEFMMINKGLNLVMVFVSILSLSAASAAPQLAPASSEEGMSEVESEVSPDTPSTIQADQEAKGELNPKDQQDVVEVQIIGEILSKSGGPTIKVNVPFKHGLHRLTTPTTLKLDPSRDHIFTPVDESCHSFEPFVLNLKKERRERTEVEAGAGDHKVRLPLLSKEHLVTLSPSPIWGGEIKDLSKFSVSVDNEPPQPLSKKPIRITSCTKRIELTHPLLNSLSIFGPFKQGQELKPTVGYKLKREYKRHADVRKNSWLITGISLLGIGVISLQASYRVDYLFQAANPNKRTEAEIELRNSNQSAEVITFLALSAVISAAYGYYRHSQIPDLEL